MGEHGFYLCAKFNIRNNYNVMREWPLHIFSRTPYSQFPLSVCMHDHKMMLSIAS